MFEHPVELPHAAIQVSSEAHAISSLANKENETLKMTQLYFFLPPLTKNAQDFRQSLNNATTNQMFTGLF